MQSYPNNEAYYDNLGAFSDSRIRHIFIRKTYSIVSLNMMITTVICACFIYVEPLRQFIRANPMILWSTLLGTFLIIIVLSCCGDIARSYPLNIVLIGIFTILESVIVGAISSVYNTEAVLIAAGITVVIVVGITIFAFQTKCDFTGAGVYIFVFSLVLIVFGIVSILIPSRTLEVIYASMGACLFTFYLVFDTQLMIGGKHTYSISPEDYVMAALNLYLDIINLFLMVLRLVGGSSRN